MHLFLIFLLFSPRLSAILFYFSVYRLYGIAQYKSRSVEFPSISLVRWRSASFRYRRDDCWYVLSFLSCLLVFSLAHFLAPFIPVFYPYLPLSYLASSNLASLLASILSCFLFSFVHTSMLMISSPIIFFYR